MSVCATIAGEGIVASLWNAVPKSTIFLLVVILILPSVIKYYSPRIKGWIGEWLVRRVLAKLPKEYRQWHDLYLLDSEGHTTQIDHLVASRYGMFVIETKNYKGWIFGTEKQKTWTQSIYRKKSKFQNPLHQNARHIRVLAEVTGLKKSDFHNIIFFVGDATLKKSLPRNVMTSNLLTYIRAESAEVFAEEQIQTFSSAVDQANLCDEPSIAKRHLRSLKTGNAA